MPTGRYILVLYRHFELLSHLVLLESCFQMNSFQNLFIPIPSEMGYLLTIDIFSSSSVARSSEFILSIAERAQSLL
jgi:hypothetical protein